MSGKTQQDSEKNLQTLFKEFYEKAKSDASSFDKTKYVNSAKASVGSLSAKLEERRQRIRKMRENATDIDREADKKESEMKDSASEANLDKDKKEAKVKEENIDKSAEA